MIRALRFFVLIFVLMLSAGCLEEFHGLYVDEGCTEDEVALMESAIEKLNAAVDREEYEVYISGRIRASKEDWTNGSLNSHDVVMCFDKDEAPSELEGFVGLHISGSILMKRHSSPEGFERTFMHELGHYVGAWHIMDKRSIMYPVQNFVINYTQADLDEFDRRLN